MNGGIRRNGRRQPEIAGLVDDCLLAELHSDADCDDVARLVKSAAHRHQPEILSVEIPWRPVLAATTAEGHHHRRVVDHVRWGTTALYRRSVDDGLESRAGLPQRLRCAIELRVVEVASSDHGADCPVARIERDERALQVRRVCSGLAAGEAPSDIVLVALVAILSESAGLNEPELSLERALSGGLKVEIECGEHLETLLVQLLAELIVELLADPLNEIRGDIAGFFLVRQAERICAR